MSVHWDSTGILYTWQCLSTGIQQEYIYTVSLDIFSGAKVGKDFTKPGESCRLVSIMQGVVTETRPFSSWMVFLSVSPP